MTNKIDEMLTMFGLNESDSIIPMLDTFRDEEEIREYCWQVLRTYPDLKKESWLVGIEGGDYIYSFGGHYVFITDDIWSFNLVASAPVLKLLVESMVVLKGAHH